MLFIVYFGIDKMKDLILLERLAIILNVFLLLFCIFAFSGAIASYGQVPKEAGIAEILNFLSKVKEFQVAAVFLVAFSVCLVKICLLATEIAVHNHKD